METINYETYLLDALIAEHDGEQFPIAFDDVIDTFGFTDQSNARAYIRRETDTLVEKKIALVRIQEPRNGKTKINKVFLSVIGYKFALARARTEKGANFLLYLLEVEKQYRANLERSFTAIAPVERDE